MTVEPVCKACDQATRAELLALADRCSALSAELAPHGYAMIAAALREIAGQFTYAGAKKPINSMAGELSGQWIPEQR